MRQRTESAPPPPTPAARRATAIERRRETCGIPRILHEPIRQTGEPVSRARIGRLMGDPIRELFA